LKLIKEYIPTNYPLSLIKKNPANYAGLIKILYDKSYCFRRYVQPSIVLRNFSTWFDV